MAKANMYLYQIYYNQETKESLDPGFIPIENSSDNGSDLFEYPAILSALRCRNYLPSDLIGVFSPRFFEKTGHAAAEVANLVESNYSLISNFSPAYESSALYLNPWHQGEKVQPGLTQCFNETIQALGFQGNMKDVVFDSNTTVFANYFVAPYFVWQSWKKVIQDVVALCDSNDPVAQKLNQYTSHRGEDSRYKMSIFVLERMISFLIFKNNWATEYLYAPERYPFSNEKMQNISSLIMACDMFKSKYLATQNRYYLEKWVEMREIAAEHLRLPH